MRYANVLVATLVAFSAGYTVRYLGEPKSGQPPATRQAAVPQPAQTTLPQSIPAASIDQAKFGGIYRTAKSIQSALIVGVTPTRFNELLQQYVSECSIVKEEAVSGPERDLAASYESAFSTLMDARTLWEMLGIFGKSYAQNNRLIELPDLPGGSAHALHTIEVKYRMRRRKGVFYEADMGPLWQTLNQQLDAANATYVRALGGGASGSHAHER
jgi:hypothetical protein